MTAQPLDIAACIEAHDAKPWDLSVTRYYDATKATAQRVMAAELTAWLAARQGRVVSGLTKAVWKSSKDPRRLFTKAQSRRIIERDMCRCAYCGVETVEGDRYIDHVIPHAAGGQTVDANGVLACGGCNLKKSNKFW